MDLEKSKTMLRCAMIVCGFILGVGHHDLLAETPTQALDKTIDRIQAISGDPGLGEDIKTDQVKDIIVNRFDFREMSKRILGVHWEQNIEKQDEFVSVFTEFTKRTYLNKIDKIKSMKISCIDEKIQGSAAKVVTSIDLSGEEFKAKFQMHPNGLDWKIYDVLLENDSFSVVRSYRTQFHWLLKALSFDELLHTIRAKNL